MGATLTTFAATLQEFYLPGVNKQLNDGTFLFSEMEKMKVKWTGKNCVVHAWISRNTGTGFSDGLLPTAGQQGTIDLKVTAKRFYGAFKVDGIVIESAPENGGHAFISWANLEMDGLIDDVKFALNFKTISGGLVKGYLNEHKPSNTVNVDQLTATATATTSAVTTFEYSGHFDEFDGSLPGRLAVVDGTPATWVPVNLIRCDTFNPVDYVSTGAAPTNQNIFVTTIDVEAMTVGLRFGSDNAVGLNQGFTTLSVDDGFAIALLVRAVTAVDSSGGPADMGRVYDNTVIGAVLQDANGIFSSLSDPAYFGETRHEADSAALPAVAADGTAKALRCRVRTMATTGAHTRISITSARMERMKNVVDVLSNREISSILIHPFFKSTYTGLSILVQNVDATKATNLDVGFKKDGYFHGNTPMRSDRHVPRGLMIMMHKKSWKTCSLSEGKFANQDGSIFSRSTNGRDEWEGFWRKYYQIICIRPNSNMILTGFSLT